MAEQDHKSTTSTISMFPAQKSPPLLSQPETQDHFIVGNHTKQASVISQVSEDKSPYIAHNECIPLHPPPGIHSLGDVLNGFDRDDLIQRIESHKQHLFYAQRDLIEAMLSIGQQLHILTEVSLSSAIILHEKQLSDLLTEIESLENTNETTRRRLHALVLQVSSSLQTFLYPNSEYDLTSA
ncbi:hypothetical protein BDV3_001470 [Batrachochytrium dendrobatidis]|nr:hypothetical protein QVD99_005391 [Batrachochytrium dendrobatidis]